MKEGDLLIRADMLKTCTELSRYVRDTAWKKAALRASERGDRYLATEDWLVAFVNAAVEETLKLLEPSDAPPAQQEDQP